MELCVCSQSQFSYRFKMQIFTAKHALTHTSTRARIASGAVNFRFYLPLRFNISLFLFSLPTDATMKMNVCVCIFVCEWYRIRMEFSIDKINLWKYHKQCDSGKIPIGTSPILHGRRRRHHFLFRIFGSGFSQFDDGVGQAPNDNDGCNLY